MTLHTFFRHEGRLHPGEIEIQLLRGLPVLNFVGLPDAYIRESGVKVKAAIRSAGLSWPTAQQIVVNMRPAHLRKSSTGVELAIALGYLSLTGQLPLSIESELVQSVVYGELSLEGRVLAPPDIGEAFVAAGGRSLLTGSTDGIAGGRWFEMVSLNCQSLLKKERVDEAKESQWKAPEIPQLAFHPKAAEIMALAAVGELSVLVAGPQGSGKSTWARALYSLSNAPVLNEVHARAQYLGSAELQRPWRPFEVPHHSASPLALVGGGVPIQPGVITRAHGGVLLMDEFLEFHPRVLEALREPVDSGIVELARGADRVQLPAKFQLLATTNLCPCGRLAPKINLACGRTIPVCRSVWNRLRGPVLDRFHMLVFSSHWTDRQQPEVRLEEVAETVREARLVMARARFYASATLPTWIHSLRLSRRREQAILRVARALSALAGETRVRRAIFTRAHEFVVDPMDDLDCIFS